MRKLNCWKMACTVCVLYAATAIASLAQTFTVLHSFNDTDGTYPNALVQATDGHLYGTTSLGGANNNAGTVFKITPRGTLTTLYSFCSQTGCTDGEYLPAGLIQATDGNFYGTANAGGDNACYGFSAGCGTIFRITPSGTLTTLHTFVGYPTDGGTPDAGLVQATDGNFYGTTYLGGDNGCGNTGCGTVFKISPSGTLMTLYSFCSQGGCTDGQWPIAGLVQASDGILYGTTQTGGANNAGEVFKITPSGTLTTLYSFCSQSGCTDGGYPYGGLVQATDGNLYGTTSYGGAGFGGGTVFKINPSGTLTSLYSFCSQSGCTDGAMPVEALIQATDGSLYGTTTGGGTRSVCSGGCGTIFKITPSGALTTLHIFDGTDGAQPYAALVQATNGALYGTTNVGGANNDGTVFSLAVGLGPFVETLPNSGKVGTPVKVLGTYLTGATSVTFNGTPAVLKRVTQTAIETSVPDGATTGTVQVVTPSGTLSSNVPFRVLP